MGNINATGPRTRVETFGHPFKGDGKFRLLVYQEDCLVGANLINCTDALASLKHAISMGRSWQEQTDRLPVYVRQAVR